MESNKKGDINNRMGVVLEQMRDSGQRKYLGLLVNDLELYGADDGKWMVRPRFTDLPFTPQATC